MITDVQAADAAGGAGDGDDGTNEDVGATEVWRVQQLGCVAVMNCIVGYPAARTLGACRRRAAVHVLKAGASAETPTSAAPDQAAGNTEDDHPGDAVAAALHLLANIAVGGLGIKAEVARRCLTATRRHGGSRNQRGDAVPRLLLLQNLTHVHHCQSRR